jgi:nicotinamidase/pyrazinamidase
MSKYAVGGIDMQRCFMPLEEGQRLHMDGFGELPVDGGEETVIAVNALLNTATINGHDSFITLEAHPEDTAHFSTQPDYVDTWPKHGRKGTPGALLHPDVMLIEQTEVFEKGQAVLLPGQKDTSYSGFNGINARGKTLGEWLRCRKAERVYLGGLALSHCVGWTAYDIKDNVPGIDVIVAIDATRSVSPETEQVMMQKLRHIGVKFQTVDEITDELAA